MQINIKQLSNKLALVTTILFLSGCATNVVVKGTIPEPLIDKLPLTASLSYTEDFTNYTYVEAQKSRRSVVSKFDFKDAQISMFDRVFDALLTVAPTGAGDTDLIIEPQVLDFQYSTPNETQTTQYEVWLKYRLQIMDGDRQNLADWVIKGYGKTPTAMLQSTSAAFNAAANVAMRDVGAQLAIRFGRQTSVQALVAEKGSFPASTDSSADQKIGESVEQAIDEDVSVLQDLAEQGAVEQDLAEQVIAEQDIVQNVEEVVDEAQQVLEQAEEVIQVPSEE